LDFLLTPHLSVELYAEQICLAQFLRYGDYSPVGTASRLNQVNPRPRQRRNREERFGLCDKMLAAIVRFQNRSVQRASDA